MLLVQVCSASGVRRYREVGGPGIEDNSEEFVLALPTVSAGGGVGGTERRGQIWRLSEASRWQAWWLTQGWSRTVSGVLPGWLGENVEWLMDVRMLGRESFRRGRGCDDGVWVKWAGGWVEQRDKETACWIEDFGTMSMAISWRLRAWTCPGD